MRMPSINWVKVAESFAACDPYAAVLMADGSIQTSGGQMLLAEPKPEPKPEREPKREPADAVDREERYEAWCRRGGRAVHTVPAFGA